ncbi:hypothetical protein IW261DRAFT_1463113 [Armillaria novae-zelandiae]|uniref:Uncharacterized protein n=1 Tax=Armillaria novae-zelandiae TaxID=153914 RepID=A0AA39PFS7_9AGAR|nr:hypothetical protein IW261DRAFT_1463113 [Armillaria novae-zelandiae]
MHGNARARWFVSCPEPGGAGPKWRPSWHQVMTKPMLPYWTNGSEVDRDETRDEDWCDVQCVEGFVWGLAVVEAGVRPGECIVKCDGGTKQFRITAPHTYPIPEDIYTLIHFLPYESPHVCIIGRSLPERRFEKVSVVETFEKDLLDITERRQYILI